MGQLDLFLTHAQHIFGLNREEGRGSHDRFYIETPVRFQVGHLSPHDAQCVNPFIFLTGVERVGSSPYLGQTTSDAPSLTILVGQYGLGKTELVFQLCHYMLGSSQRSLPINLSMCRDGVNVLDMAPSGRDFANLLFDHILKSARMDRSVVDEHLIPAINEGKVFLILDALDELVATPIQHRHFLVGLMQFLSLQTATSETVPEFRVLITMRLEYLSVISNEPGVDLDRTVHAHYHLLFPVYFLALDYFENSRVRAYFTNRFGLEEGRQLYDQVRTKNRLLDMLRRPLLLRLFCDLLDNESDRLGLVASFQDEYTHPAYLLQRFVTNASQSTLPDQKQLTPFIWDLERLALASLHLYSIGNSKLSAQDIRHFLKPIDSTVSYDAIAQLADNEVLDSVHKCPFFKLAEDNGNEYTIQFAHRVFFEYFVARGMALEFEQEDATDKFISFDELVLNVDMRKFLRDLVEDKWYMRTKKSYGLDNPEQWPHLAKLNLDELDKRRKTLLDAMTTPERPPKETVEAVEWLLSLNHDWLHPRYLVYNYEAVAVYLWYNRWQHDINHMRRRFGECMLGQIDKALKILPDEHPELRDALELLIERILDIGYRLRYKWSEEYARTKRDLVLQHISDPQTKKRIDKIFEYIAGAIF